MLAAMDSCFDVVQRQGLHLSRLAASARPYKLLFWPFLAPSVELYIAYS
mgnify:CR=1 FL=1